MSRSSITRIAKAIPSALRNESIAGPSMTKRYASTESAPKAVYPFNTRVSFPPPTTDGPPAKRLTNPKKGWSVILHLQKAMRAQLDKQNVLNTWFASKGKDRILSGSVLTVTTWTSPAKTSTNTFSGILMGVHRGGVDTSIRLRNIVNRVGVEMLFKVLSPMVKEIRVIKAATRGGKKGGLKALRQSRPYYVRERPEILRQVAGVIKSNINDAKAVRGRR